MSSIFIDPMPGRCWPLHPQPADWEDLETWVRRIADMYGVSYDAFLLNALGHTGGGARDLDHAPVHVLARLSAGTGIPIERLRDMTTQRVLGRTAQWTGEARETPQGHAALDCLRAMGSRRGRRMSAVRGF
jgi:hypothetical protein